MERTWKCYGWTDGRSHEKIQVWYYSVTGYKYVKKVPDKAKSTQQIFTE